MSTLYTRSGRRLKLGPELGRGGEGAVYNVAGRPDVVAKVYHEPPDPPKALKLERMVAARSPALTAVSAWPVDVLMEHPRGAASGLVMPAVNGHHEAHVLYGPKSRKAILPDADYRFLVHVAANVARAFATVHNHGHVVGDVNHSGVMVSPNGTVRLIDCDSFQVSLGGDTFRCRVGVPEYTPPELQGVALDGVDRSPDHDRFGLAVMVFLLLFMGRHPFAGRWTGPGHMPIDEAIRKRLFAFNPQSARRGMGPPPATPGLGVLPPDVCSLFGAAFGRSVRPTASHWVHALEGMASGMRRCGRVGTHTFWGGAGACPWCAAESATGTAFFVPTGGGPVLTSAPSRPQSPPSRPPASVDAALASIGRVTPPRGFALALPTGTPSNEAREIASRARARAAKWRPRLEASIFLAGASMVVISVVAYLASSGGPAFLLGVVGWMVASARSKFPLPLPLRDRKTVRGWRREVVRSNKRVRALDAAIAEAGGSEYERVKEELDRSAARYAELEGAEASALRGLESKARAAALDLALARYSVRDCKRIPGIGAAKVQSLISSGVYTAADVTRDSVMKVRGFGPSLTDEVVAWRNRLETGARRTLSVTASPRDVDAVRRRFAPEKAALSSVIRAGAARLSSAARRDEGRVGPLLIEAYQAKSDLVRARANLDGVVRARRR